MTSSFNVYFARGMMHLILTIAPWCQRTANSCRIQSTGLLVWLLLLRIMCREHLTVCHELILCLNHATVRACWIHSITRLGSWVDINDVWLFITERNRIYCLIMWGPVAVFCVFYFFIYFLSKSLVKIYLNIWGKTGEGQQAWQS